MRGPIRCLRGGGLAEALHASADLVAVRIGDRPRDDFPVAFFVRNEISDVQLHGQHGQRQVVVADSPSLLPSRHVRVLQLRTPRAPMSLAAHRRFRSSAAPSSSLICSASSRATEIRCQVIRSSSSAWSGSPRPGAYCGRGLEGGPESLTPFRHVSSYGPR